MSALGFLLFVLLVIYAVTKRRKDKENAPPVIDARLQVSRSEPVAEATAQNLGITARPNKTDWSKYDHPTVIRQVRAKTI